MNSSDTQFAGSIPQLYETLLVPLIFRDYAIDLAKRVSAKKPRNLLEIAAGTGIVTREITARLAPDARLTATDLNPPMLEQAKQNLNDDRITWRQADALALPFDDQSFDLVACQFGAMFFPDRIRGYREARRVLEAGGAFLFNSWDRIEENVFTDVIEQALSKRLPQDPPKFMSRTPHGYFDANRIRSDLESAGFSDITIETITQISKAPSAEVVATAFCQGTPLRGELEARGLALAEATSIAAEALTRRFGRGPIEGPISALVISATN